MRRPLAAAAAVLLACASGLVVPAAMASAQPENVVKPAVVQKGKPADNYNSDLNQEWYWEAYYTDLGYENVSCTKFDDLDGKTWQVPAGEWIGAIVKAGSGNSTENPNNIVSPVGDVLSHDSGKDISHIILCSGTMPQDVTEITPPVPTAVDPCNASGVTNNVEWETVLNTDEYTWTLEADGSLTVTANEGYVFTDNRTSVNYPLPADDGVKCNQGPTTIVPPVPTPYDECNAVGVSYNVIWEPYYDSEQYAWTLNADGSLTVTAKPGYVFTGGQASVTYYLPADDGIPCELPPTTINPPVPQPTDPCNASGVSYNVTWQTYLNTEQYTWTLNGDGSLTVTANPGYVFTGGQASVTYYLPADEGIPCTVTIYVPAQPTHADPCNTAVGQHNATWNVPADTAQLRWVLQADGNLWVYTNTGYKFTNGQTSHNFGLAPEDGFYCSTGTA